MTELVKELDALKTALDGLDQLDSSTAPSAFLDIIKFVATDCRQRLEVFWAKTEKYDSSLGPASRSNALRGTMDKLDWTFCHKEEVVQLQRNLQYYSKVINMLMIRHVAGQVQDMRKETDAVCTQIAERIRDTQDTLADVGKDVSSQGIVASNTQTLITGLHQFIFGEVRSFLADLGQLVNKVFASTQQIFAVVLEIRDSNKVMDTGWTYFQDPFVVEDAFGRKFPVPSEFDYDMLDTIDRRKFQTGVGSQDQEVKAAAHHVAHLRFPLQHTDASLAPTYHHLRSPLIPTPFIPHQQQIALMANHRAMQEMSRLEDLQLQRELKQSVLGYIIDMYQPAYPNNHGFSILICRHMFDRSSSIPAAAALGRRNDREEFIMIRAVTLSSASPELRSGRS
ncbi:hypothetical protein BKA58DRAFT_448594 [Alternaria rosae]|uniref:uncharacterized protein n=1 Tax=Alternaria rosae TaxID=1187941 RepID=UPI001E8D1BDD|nr:uncharacterized protein BKA58DRAFT_448594 [Alternaria rosae]KAH6860841.1 hypothetical protein BKA58DRAFT_448594 [Alternaria rosae]